MFDGMNKSVVLVIINSLFTSIGFFAFIPFLSIYLINDLSWSPLLAGTLLMVRQVSQQGTTFWTGMTADRIGLKQVLCLGLFVRAVGFALFAVDSQISTLFFAAVVSGLGGAMFNPASSGIIASLTLPEHRLRVVSLQKLINNVGIVLSAGLGALLISFNFALLSLACGSIYLVLAVVSYFYLEKVESQPKKLSYRKMSHVVLADKRFLSYTLISSGLWYLSMQLYLTVPLQAYAVTGDKALVPLVNMVVAIVVIFLQYPLINWMGRKLSLYNNIAAGAAFLGTGLLIVGASASLYGLISGLAVFACGIIIVEPTNFDITARMAKPDMSATYFGFASIAMAVGGGISQVMGGWLFQQGPLLIWGSCALVTGMVLIGLQLFKKVYCCEICRQ